MKFIDLLLANNLKRFKEISLICIINLTQSFCIAQVNLVPNPSFEDTISCNPNNWMSLSSTQKWYNATQGTCDYFNSCGTTTIVQAGPFGQEVPHFGNAFAGFIAYFGYKSVYPDYREYLMIELNQPLSQNSKYLVQFYLSLGDKCNYSVSNIGAYFATPYDTLNISSIDAALSFTPQIINKNLTVLPKIGWQLITDTMTTISGQEKYLILGNFAPLNTFTPSFIGPVNQGGVDSTSYLFIDDIVVTKIGSTVDVKKYDLSNNITIKYENERLKISDETLQLYNVKVIDLNGKTLVNKRNNSGITFIDFSPSENGIYLLEIEQNSNIFRRRFIK